MEERVGNCANCGRPFGASGGPGRPRRYCRRSCRQRAYERRTHDGDLEWSGERYRQLSAALAQHEDALDRVKGVMDELRRDVVDDVRIDGVSLLGRLEDALD